MAEYVGAVSRQNFVGARETQGVHLIAVFQHNFESMIMNQAAYIYKAWLK